MNVWTSFFLVLSAVALASPFLFYDARRTGREDRGNAGRTGMDQAAEGALEGAGDDGTAP